MNDMLQNMSTADSDNSTDISNTCANCGKEGSDVNNTCNKCNSVMYCNAACKKRHRHKHKKECEEYLRLAAEQAAKLHDEVLFKRPPPEYEDCPICFLRMPTLCSGFRYQICCGKIICSGCDYAPVYDDKGNVITEETCPFCRTPYPATSGEAIERMKQRVEAGDDIAIRNLGNYYANRQFGFPQDYTKALDLWHQAAELGNANANYSIGNAYLRGDGVEVDEKKATHHWEIAAMKGSSHARYNLGSLEASAGNMDRALKHYMIAVRAGCADSLDMIKRLYSSRHATKEDYMEALRSYQEYLNEVKSVQRDEAAASHKKQSVRRAATKSFQTDKAAAADDEYKYY